MPSIEVLANDVPEALRQIRRERRWSTALPLRLTTGSGEVIPAVVLNVSATGLLALIDVRHSSSLPPPRGARLVGDLFLDELALQHAVLEVLRVEKQSEHLRVLGCKFVHTPAGLSPQIRGRVTGQLATSRSRGRSR
jgi:PilZ domain